jgi:oligopeptide transport system permease protein
MFNVFKHLSIQSIFGPNLNSNSFLYSTLRRFYTQKLALYSLLLIGVIAIMCILVPLCSNYQYNETDFQTGLQAPSFMHLFGTDGLGRDIFVRVFIGGRITFEIAFAATLVIIVIGVIYGSIAGLIGGKVDIIMMRIIDILYGIPFLFFSILLLTVFGQSLKLSFIAIAAISWLDMARVVRGQTLSIKHKQFIEVAITLGVNKRKIIMRHIIPNLLNIVVIYAALAVPNMIVLSTVISFFGLGVVEPMTSWGMLINDGVQNLNSWWLLLFPAGIMTITLLAFAFVVNGLRDALDTR